MPIINFPSLADVPDEFKSAAKEADGKFQVDVALTSAVTDLKTKNTQVSAERDGLKAKADKFDALVGAEGEEKFTKELTDLRATDQKVKDGQLKGSDAIEAEVVRRLGTVKDDHARQLSEKARETGVYKTQAEAAQAQLRNMKIDQAVSAAALDPKSGVEPSALPDILSRARTIYVVEDDKLVPKDGQAIVYGPDGVTPMSPKEWLGKLKEQAPYFFKDSKGGGANGGGGGGKATTIGGYSKEEFLKLPPEQRMKIAREAGVEKI